LAGLRLIPQKIIPVAADSVDCVQGAFDVGDELDRLGWCKNLMRLRLCQKRAGCGDGLA
jgi:hypothetical protein